MHLTAGDSFCRFRSQMKKKERANMREIRLAVFDFDNTLWESLRASEIAARAFITKLCEDSGLPEGDIKSGIRHAFENNHIFEYPDTIRHNPVLQAAFPGEQLDRRFAAAAELFHETMKAQACPYEGVRGMLRKLKLSGFKLACYSESNAADLSVRMRHMGIDSLFDIICSSPVGQRVAASDKMPIMLREVDHGLAARHMVAYDLPFGGPKDHPEVLSLLLAEMNIAPHEAIMVGDHLVRDVAMAQKAGVHGFWARYGRSSIGDLELTPEIHPYVQHMCEQHFGGLDVEVHPDAVLNTAEDVLLCLDIASQRKVLPFPHLAPRLARKSQAVVDSGRLQ